MYLFEAKYINMDDGREIIRKIELFEEETEESTYITAMKMAYHKKKENECFASLEFIYS